MHSGNSAAIIWRTGRGWWKFCLTRVRGSGLFHFPLKEDAPELSSVRRISSDSRRGTFFLKKRILPGVGVSFVLEGVSSGRKYFVGNGQEIYSFDFGENFLIRPLVTHVTSRSPGVSRGFSFLFLGRAQGPFGGSLGHLDWLNTQKIGAEHFPSKWIKLYLKFRLIFYEKPIDTRDWFPYTIVWQRCFHLMLMNKAEIGH